MSKRSKPRPAGSQKHRIKRDRQGDIARKELGDRYPRNESIDCGWGRLIFANTFRDPRTLVETLEAEGPDRRDIAFYVQDPQVVLAQAPQEVFLDPSHAFRLDLATYRSEHKPAQGYFLRRLTTEKDAEAINAIYAAAGMVRIPTDFFWSHRDARAITVLVAEEAETGEIIGTVMGVDHARAFGDPARGSSLWCLAVSPQARWPGIGKALVRRLAEHFKVRGAATMDLSVLHDNEEAIGLYEKLGFRRFQAFTVKRKNPINEPLFTSEAGTEGLNPYAMLIVKEARRRGIAVRVIDAEAGFFELRHGGRTLRCRESLSDMTSAVAMSICDDKRVTRRVVEAAGVRVAKLCEEDSAEARAAFLEDVGSVVVKPARGEMGDGVAVDVTTVEDMEDAVARAREHCQDVLVEEFMTGHDLRLVVIDKTVVATAMRQPPSIVGDGRATARDLIAAQSRRREAATGGESRIPLDAETERCLAADGLTLDAVVPEGQEVTVRKTANLHTGGMIVDTTERTHPDLIAAAERCAEAIDIPVTGIDLMVKDASEPDYIFIEANERPGLANHEPQPTAERFVDLLFPMSRGVSRKPGQGA